MMTRSDIEPLYSKACLERSKSFEISGWMVNAAAACRERIQRAGLKALAPETKWPGKYLSVF